MSWQSMFDGGACTVSFWIDTVTGTPSWSGLMGKGDTSPIYTDAGPGTQYQATVDANGVVTLNQINAGSLASVRVEVDPQYDVSAVQTQMLGMSASPLGSSFVVTASNNDAAENVVVVIDGTTGAGTPSSATFSPYAGAACGLSMPTF